CSHAQSGRAIQEQVRPRSGPVGWVSAMTRQARKKICGWYTTTTTTTTTITTTYIVAMIASQMSGSSVSNLFSGVGAAGRRPQAAVLEKDRLKTRHQLARYLAPQRRGDPGASAV